MNTKQLLLVILHCGALFGCSKSETEPKPAPIDKPAKISDQVHLSDIARERFDISTTVVKKRNAVETVSTSGEIKEDDNRVFHINSLTTGRVQKDFVSLGQAIHAGQTLAVIHNLEIIKIYTDYIHQSHKNKVDTSLAETKLELAKKNYARIKTLFDENIAPEKDVIKAASDLKIEEQTVAGLKECAKHLRLETAALLKAYGVKMPAPDEDTIASTSPIVTPKAGVIIKKNVTVGDVVSNSEPLYVVADLSKVWLDLAVYDQQLASIRQGSIVKFVSDSLPGKRFTGRVTYVKPATDESSGTFTARVELENPGLILKPGMLGQATVENQTTRSLPFIPEEALQRQGNESFIFIVQPDGTYKKRIVVLGQQLSDGYLAEHGISADELIVTKGSFLLKAEMQKSSMAEDE